MFNSLGYDFMVSWLPHEGIHSTDYLLKWINEQNESLEVRIDKIALEESPFWFYENGAIINKNRSFYSEMPVKFMRYLITELRLIRI